MHWCAWVHYPTLYRNILQIVYWTPDCKNSKRSTYLTVESVHDSTCVVSYGMNVYPLSILYICWMNNWKKLCRISKVNFGIGACTVHCRFPLLPLYVNDMPHTLIRYCRKSSICDYTWTHLFQISSSCTSCNIASSARVMKGKSP